MIFNILIETTSIKNYLFFYTPHHFSILHFSYFRRDFFFLYPSSNLPLSLKKRPILVQYSFSVINIYPLKINLQKSHKKVCFFTPITRPLALFIGGFSFIYFYLLHFLST